MTIDDLEITWKELNRTYESMIDNPRSEDFEKIDRVHQRLLVLERQRAMAHGWETAVPADWVIPWAIDASERFSYSDRRAEIVFFVDTNDFRWKSRQERLKIVGEGAQRIRPKAQVVFVNCDAVRVTTINDELFTHQPLYGRGLTIATGHIVENSNWIKDIIEVQRKHRSFKKEAWDLHRHYILTFKEHTFECIATAFSVDLLVTKRDEEAGGITHQDRNNPQTDGIAEKGP